MLLKYNCIKKYMLANYSWGKTNLGQNKVCLLVWKFKFSQKRALRTHAILEMTDSIKIRD
jgi:hypothetical protein